jgi:hypothetical protein
MVEKCEGTALVLTYDGTVEFSPMLAGVVDSAELVAKLRVAVNANQQTLQEWRNQRTAQYVSWKKNEQNMVLC